MKHELTQMDLIKVGRHKFSERCSICDTTIETNIYPCEGFHSCNGLARYIAKTTYYVEAYGHKTFTPWYNAKIPKCLYCKKQLKPHTKSYLFASKTPEGIMLYEHYDPPFRNITKTIHFTNGQWIIEVWLGGWGEDGNNRWCDSRCCWEHNK